MHHAFTFSLLGCEITAVSQSDHVLTIAAHTIAPTASCPRCEISSRRILWALLVDWSPMGPSTSCPTARLTP